MKPPHQSFISAVQIHQLLPGLSLPKVKGDILSTLCRHLRYSTKEMMKFSSITFPQRNQRFRSSLLLHSLLTYILFTSALTSVLCNLEEHTSRRKIYFILLTMFIHILTLITFYLFCACLSSVTSLISLVNVQHCRIST